LLLYHSFIGLAYEFAADKSFDEEGDCTLVTLILDGEVGHYCAPVAIATSLGRATSILLNMEEYQGWQVFQCHADAEKLQAFSRCVTRRLASVRSPNTVVLSLLKVPIPRR